MMKRLMALLLAMALLCGAAVAESGSLKAALDDALEAVLYGSFEDVCRMIDPNTVSAEDLQPIYDTARSYGEAESYSVVNVAVQGQYIVGEYEVVQAMGEFRYSIILSANGKLVGLSVDAAPAELGETVVDESIDFQARVQEVMDLLMRGEYELFAAEVREDVAASISVDMVKEIVEVYGEPEMYALVHLQKAQGYHQAVFEVKQSEKFVQYQLTLDGSGMVVGMQADEKAPDGRDFSWWEERKQWKAAEKSLMHLLDGEYEQAVDAMSDQMKQQLTPEALEEMFASLGEAQEPVCYDLWQQNGYISADFIVQHAEQEMLYRISMDSDAAIVGLGYYPIVRVEK